MTSRYNKWFRWRKPQSARAKVDDACARVSRSLRSAVICLSLEKEMSPSVDCTGKSAVVPTIYHSVAGAHNPPHLVRMNALANPSFRMQYHDDKSAQAYVERMCGEDVARAYDCLRPPAYRADLFRFCALHSEGGVYVDSDVVALVPFEQLYSRCSNVSIGIDIPQQKISGKQMKIVAGRKGSPIFKCMIDSIVANVHHRVHPSNPLMVSGPQLLHVCSERVAENISFSYIDSHDAAWPYTGLRSHTQLLAYEVPNVGRHWKHNRSDDYDDLFHKGKTYTEHCRIKPAAKTARIPKVLWGAWKDRASIPSKARNLRNAWTRHNPSWTSQIVVDADVRTLAITESTRKAFVTAPLGVMRADLMRYILMYQHGGMWLDLDVEHVLRIDAWLHPTAELAVGIESTKRSVTEDRGHMCQWFFAARPKHGVFDLAIRLATERILRLVGEGRHAVQRAMKDPNQVHFLTGPALFTDSVCKYFGVSPCVDMAYVSSKLPTSVQVLPENDVRFAKMKHHFASAHWPGYKSWVEEKRMLARIAV